MRRFIRSIQHKFLILIGKADIIYPDLDIEGYSSINFIPDYVMEENKAIYNVGYSSKYGGYVLISTSYINNKLTQ